MSNVFKDRLLHAMELRNVKPVELAEKTGLSKARISQYMNGVYVPKSKGTHLIAKALQVNETWLMGIDESMERAITDNTDDLFSQFDNLSPIQTQRIPMLGEIACGEPIWCDEDRESYIEAGTNIRADFCLKAKGDSMINARICDGDIVFIRQQPLVENGDIAAVIIDNEATLKRVYFDKENGKLVLQAENPKYMPLVYIGDELNSIRILGKAIAFESSL